jgi:peptide/nickel transport system substrate-binding protein
MAQMFAEQAAEAGVTVNVITSPPAEYWDNVWMKQPFAGSSWLMRHRARAWPSPTLIEYNETHWFIEEYDTALGSGQCHGRSGGALWLYGRQSK